MANRTFRVGEKYNSGLDKKLYTIFFYIQKNNVIILDGDEIRKGISKDLGFSITDRTENVRRIAEISKITNRTWIYSFCSLHVTKTCYERFS